MSDLCVKAGKNIYNKIRSEGLNFDNITVFVGPAVGPRWLLASGFDLALIKAQVLGNHRPLLLAGASAGALRFSAWVQPEPEKSYRNLLESYIPLTFTRRDTAGTILEKISNVIDTFIEEDALSFALSHKKYRLALFTARAKHIVASEIKIVQGLGFSLTFLLNVLHSSFLRMFFQRVMFFNGPMPPRFCADEKFAGKTAFLSEINFRHVLLASSSVPLSVAGVKNIFGADNGTYRDGGVTDYYVNQRFAAGEDEIALLFNHHEHIIPGWLDKKLKYRKPRAEYLENILMVYPSEKFIQKLPEGRTPERKDFKTFADNPSRRIENWEKAVQLAQPLGEQFLEIVASGKIRGMVKPF